MQQLDPAEVLYQRRCAKYIYVVPEGLRELMSDISREVLRYNPPHLYSFISDYLDSLLITRENARVAAKLVDNLTETSVIIAELLQQTNITRLQADRAARIIQRAFRRQMRDKSDTESLSELDLLEKIVKKTTVTFEEADRAVGVIQRAFRYYKSKKQEQTDGIDWWLAARHTIGILDKLKVPKAEIVRSATLIKAAYKGYYMRKNMKKMLESQIIESEVSNVDYVSTSMEEDFETDELQDIHNQILNHAAMVIQRTFRAYTARHHILCGITHQCSFLERYQFKSAQKLQNILEMMGEQTLPSTPEEDSLDYNENPFESLLSHHRILAVNISLLGYPLPRVARACQAFYGDEGKIMDYLLAMNDFLEQGFPESKVQNALFQFDNDREKVLNMLTT